MKQGRTKFLGGGEEVLISLEKREKKGETRDGDGWILLWEVISGEGGGEKQFWDWNLIAGK